MRGGRTRARRFPPGRLSCIIRLILVKEAVHPADGPEADDKHINKKNNQKKRFHTITSFSFIVRFFPSERCLYSGAHVKNV